MKKRYFFLDFVGILFILFQIEIGNASVVNHFVPPDQGNSTVINLNFPQGTLPTGRIKGLSQGWLFGVYDYDNDYDNENSSLDLLEGSSEFKWDEVKLIVTQTDGKYSLNATFTNSTFIGNIFLGNSPDFGFYFSNGTARFKPSDITQKGPNTYLFTYAHNGTEENIWGKNLNPVPLPATIMLLGTSLMGLLIVGNRRR